jgi:hypothetical protein
VVQAESYRQLVTARAGGACEYCRLLELATGVTFHVEHVRPQFQGGETVMGNLALSCPGCNLAKGDRIVGRDKQNRMRPLFNPRGYEPWLLGWHLHFILDRKTGLIVPRSPAGEATILTLDMNSSHRLFARKLQLQVGLMG